MGFFMKNKENSIKEQTVIARHTKIVGDIEVDRDLYIDGEVKGDIRSSKLVAIGKTGRCEGEIKAQTVIVSGVVKGVIEAKRVDIISGGRVIGEVFAKHFSVETMGVFNGIHHQENEEEIVQIEEAKE